MARNQGSSTTARHRSRCDHRGEEVQVGPYTVLAAGTMYLSPEDMSGVDVVIPLTETGRTPEYVDLAGKVVPIPIPDFGGAPAGWRETLLTKVIPELEAGHKVMVFCAGSHGRTGMFIASLIALLESEKDTPDPIAAARERHCSHAVETGQQAQAVYALRG